MKCTSKKEYECLYLDKNNIDEFVKWFKAKINNNVVSYKYDEDDNDYCYVVIAIKLEKKIIKKKLCYNYHCFVYFFNTSK